MSIELKIKVKHLAEEARIIRTEERKLSGMAKWKLQHHRKTTVRNAARRTQIAYAVCRGRDPSAPMAHDSEHYYGRCRSDWPEVERMVKKYGDESAQLRLPEVQKLLGA